VATGMDARRTRTLREIMDLRTELPMKTPDPITSLENQWFRRFRKALDSHDDEIVFEGPKQIRDAIAGGLEALAVATTAAGAKALTAPLSVSPLLFSDRLFEKLAATSSSQGILALFKRPQTTLEGLLALRLPLVALDSIQDPGMPPRSIWAESSLSARPRTPFPSEASALPPARF